MRKIILFLLFAAYAFSATSFYVAMKDTTGKVAPGEAKVLEGYVHNTSTSDIFMQATRVTNDIPGDWTTTLCFGDNCYPPFVSVVPTDDNGNPAFLPIAAGDSAFFDITFNTSESSGSARGEAMITFVDVVSTEADTVLFSVTAETPGPAFAITVPDTSVEMQAGQSHEFTGMVYNTSDKPLTFFMVRRQNNIPASWSTSLCFGACPQAEVDTVNSLIMNGDSLEYTVTFNTSDQSADSGSVYMAFYADGETDTVTQVFKVNTTLTDMEHPAEIPVTSFRLLGNFPNPFNPVTTIRYQLSQLSRVVLTVYDLSGKTVYTQDLGRQKSGLHQYRLNAENLSSGSYLYRIQANGHIRTGKMLLLK
jgi:hypothetical protein